MRTDGDLVAYSALALWAGAMIYAINFIWSL